MIVSVSRQQTSLPVGKNSASGGSWLQNVTPDQPPVSVPTIILQPLQRLLQHALSCITKLGSDFSIKLNLKRKTR